GHGGAADRTRGRGRWGASRTRPTLAHRVPYPIRRERPGRRLDGPRNTEWYPDQENDGKERTGGRAKRGKGWARFEVRCEWAVYAGWAGRRRSSGQSLTTPSTPAVAAKRPSRLRAKAETPAKCQSNAAMVVRVSGSSMCSTPSTVTKTSRRPSADTA